MDALRDALGSAIRCRRAPPLPPVAGPAARGSTRRRPEKRAFAAEAARHTTALVGIGHVGTRYATDVVLQFQAELAVAHAAVGAELPDDWAEQQRLRRRCARGWPTTASSCCAPISGGGSTRTSLARAPRELRRAASTSS